MSKVHITVSQPINAPIERVFDLIKDSNALGKAAGLPMKRIRDGAEPDGPGTVRRVGPPVIGAEETILDVVPNEVVRYTISRNGGPIRNYQAEMRVCERDGGTELAWVMNFEMLWPLSAVAQRAVPLVAGQVLRKVAKHF
ncbi:MAG: SRPBCC family protein [Panacagrimonas sp.]